MCVIVHQPIGQTIDKTTAEKLWSRNPDGGGFAYVDDNQRLQVFKTMQFGEFWRKFETARSNFPGRDYLLHMRIATHGSVNINNVHPFVVDDHTVMAHNGIIHPVTDRLEPGDDRSDTRYFIDEVIPKLPENWLDDPDLRVMVDKYIGWSKLMFITTNPLLTQQVYRLGEWDDWKGLPMSNTNGLITQQKTYQFTTGGDYQQRESPKSGNIYQLPLPRQAEKKVVDAVFDKSDEWADWLEYRDAVYEEFDTDIQKTALQSAEFDFLLDAVKTERATMHLIKPIVVVDQLTGQLECTECMKIIDLNTAECECWDLICQGCWNFLALCQNTGDGCDENRTIFDYEALSKKGREFVNEGGLTKYSPQERKKLEKRLSKTGAGNTSTT